MTGYQSKKAMARDKLETWDTPSEAFNEWWNNDYDDSTNPYELDTFAYWAWAGWQAALAQPEQAEVLAQAVPDETLTIVYQSGYYDGKKAAQHPWVDLTEDELVQIGVATGLERAAVEMISSMLKEMNT